MLGSSPLFVYGLSIAFTLVIGLILFLGAFAIQKNNKQASYDAQLDELLHDDEDGPIKVTLATRWNRFWGERFKGLGMSKYSDDNNTAGRDVLLVGVGIAVVLTLFFRNPLPAVAISAAVLYAASVVIKMKADKESDKINDQLPGFLFALKANVQANETPERAILKVVDSMPSPLYEDLVLVKQRILANSTFSDALEELSQKTASRDLKFLCACMIQAAGTGANLENQITVIQNVLEQRRKVSDELAKAVRSATPAIWVASAVIPGTFIITYFMDPNARDFWFHDGLSWAALAAVLILYGFGVWMSKILVDNIKSL